MEQPSKDEIMLQNALKLLQKGKFELTGEEALAFRQVFEYLLGRLKACRLPLAAPVESPIKQEIKSKKKK